jgi:hypothetical protein
VFAFEQGVSTSELLGVTSQQALRFFYEHLLDVTDDSAPPRDELLYNASVLAHFATTSIASEDGFPACPAGLSTVFELYVIGGTPLPHDPEIVEAAASQCLLLTGFFQAQQRQRHQIEWYAALGSAFFARAARLSQDPRRARLLMIMARRFLFWREQQHRLAIELREAPLLIDPVRESEPPWIM